MNSTKVCTKCQEEKPLTSDFFTVRQNRKSGFCSRCRNCRNEAQRKRNQLPSNKVREKERSRRRYSENRIPNIIRTGIRKCINSRFIKRSRSWDYIGLSIQEFKDYLELKFQPGMSWENYGKPDGDFHKGWHIDHKRPLISFNFNGADAEEQLKIAWHYSNLQPLWAIDNIRKSGKY